MQQPYSDTVEFDPSHPRISHPIAKVSKKLLASQVNSVRPYKSRSKRPCDFCRRRKTCCIIEGSIPCMSCRQFNKGQCTFVEKPLKRNKRDIFPEDAESNATGTTGKGRTRKSNKRPMLDAPAQRDSPILGYGVANRKSHMHLHSHPHSHPNSHLHSHSQMALPKLGGFVPRPSSLDYTSWSQTPDSSRSQSTGNIHSQNCAAQAQVRGHLFADPLDAVSTRASAPSDAPLYQELVEEYRQYSAQQQQQQQQQQQEQQQPHTRVFTDFFPHTDSFDSHVYSANYTSGPYNYYGSTSVESAPQLDNSEFVSSSSNSNSIPNSISSSRLSTSMWSPQATLDSGLGSAIGSAIDSVIDLGETLDQPESVHDAECTFGAKHQVGAQVPIAPLQLPSQSRLAYADVVSRGSGNSGSGGWLSGANGAISVQSGVYQATQM